MTDFYEITIKNFSGLSSEIKPTIAAGTDVPNGSRWREVDTEKIFYFNLSDDTWYEINERTVLLDEDSNNYNVQNPMPTNGDRVYAKDLDIERIVSTNWVGDIDDLVGDLLKGMANSSADNPKSLTIWFEWPVITNGMGLGAVTGNFKNSKITAVTASGLEVLIDESSDNTPKQTLEVEFEPTGFSGLIIEFYTDDEVNLSTIFIAKSIQVVSRLQALSEKTRLIENIKSFEGALNVTDGLVHKVPINRYFTADAGPSTNPTNAITAGDRVITLDDVTGLSSGGATTPDGDYLYIEENSTYEMQPLQIIDITGNDVTVNREIDNSYTTAAVVKEVLINMNVDGSTTAVSFKVKPPTGEIWQLTRYIPYGLDNAAMEDTNFMGLSALLRGVAVRTSKNGIIRTPSVWHTTGDMANDMYDLIYPDKVPAGKYSVRGRWTITKMGAILELVGDDGDYVELLVQDNLVGIEKYTNRLQGRIFGL